MADAYRFDATKVKPSAGFDPVPNDWYRASITHSLVKATKAGDGKIMEFTWTIADGPYAGRLVWSRLNIENPSEAAQQIAEAELSAICHATGVLQLKNTTQLHAKPCLIKVIIKKQTGYEDKNEIKQYNADGDRPNGKPVAAAAPAQKPAEREYAPAKEAEEDDLPF